jgi:hypothetical protein
MIEYRDWAKAQLNPEHNPSLYDWQGMPLAEMANRALAICKEARDAPLSKYGHSISVVYAFQSLEAMAKAIKEQYPRRSGT